MKLRAFTLLAGLVIATPALSASLTVNGTDDIFRAGGNNNALDGTNPSSVGFSAAASQVLTFQSVTGTWSCCSNIAGTVNGPDGGSGAGGLTDINSSNRIAGIVNTSGTMFLVGLFLDASLPATAPARLNFSAGQLTQSFTSLTPQIGQVFFIGDGLTGTGSGSTQQFLVPTTATRLFLGIADAFGFNGDPGFYSDNLGFVTANFTITGNRVPEPGSLSLLALLGAFAFVGVRSRRRLG